MQSCPRRSERKRMILVESENPTLLQRMNSPVETVLILGPGPGNANMQTPMLVTNRGPCHVLTMPVTNRAPCMCDLTWQTEIILWITDKYINSNLYHMNTFSYLFQFWLCIFLATSVPSSTPTSNVPCVFILSNLRALNGPDVPLSTCVASLSKILMTPFVSRNLKWFDFYLHEYQKQQRGH